MKWSMPVSSPFIRFPLLPKACCISSCAGMLPLFASVLKIMKLPRPSLCSFIVFMLLLLPLPTPCNTKRRIRDHPIYLFSSCFLSFSPQTLIGKWQIIISHNVDQVVYFFFVIWHFHFLLDPIFNLKDPRCF